SVLLLRDYLHVGRVLGGKNFTQGLFIEVADAQRRVGIAARAAIYDSSRHDLNGGQESRAGAILIRSIIAADLNPESGKVLLGNDAAAVVVDGLVATNGDTRTFDPLDNFGQLASRTMETAARFVEAKPQPELSLIQQAIQCFQIEDESPVEPLG